MRALTNKNLKYDQTLEISFNWNDIYAQNNEFELSILINLVILTQDFIKSFSSEIFSQIWNGANDESWAYENQEITCNY